MTTGRKIYIYGVGESSFHPLILDFRKSGFEVQLITSTSKNNKKNDWIVRSYFTKNNVSALETLVYFTDSLGKAKNFLSKNLEYQSRIIIALPLRTLLEKDAKFTDHIVFFNRLRGNVKIVLFGDILSNDFSSEIKYKFENNTFNPLPLHIYNPKKIYPLYIGDFSNVLKKIIFSLSSNPELFIVLGKPVNLRGFFDPSQKDEFSYLSIRTLFNKGRETNKVNLLEKLTLPVKYFYLRNNRKKVLEDLQKINYGKSKPTTIRNKFRMAFLAPLLIIIVSLLTPWTKLLLTKLSMESFNNKNYLTARILSNAAVLLPQLFIRANSSEFVKTHANILNEDAKLNKSIGLLLKNIFTAQNNNKSEELVITARLKSIKILEDLKKIESISAQFNEHIGGFVNNNLGRFVENNYMEFERNRVLANGLTEFAKKGVEFKVTVVIVDSKQHLLSGRIAKEVVTYTIKDGKIINKQNNKLPSAMDISVGMHDFYNKVRSQLLVESGQTIDAIVIIKENAVDTFVSKVSQADFQTIRRLFANNDIYVYFFNPKYLDSNYLGWSGLPVITDCGEYCINDNFGIWDLGETDNETLDKQITFNVSFEEGVLKRRLRFSTKNIGSNNYSKKIEITTPVGVSYSEVEISGDGGVVDYLRPKAVNYPRHASIVVDFTMSPGENKLISVDWESDLITKKDSYYLLSTNSSPNLKDSDVSISLTTNEKTKLLTIGGLRLTKSGELMYNSNLFDERLFKVDLKYN